MINCNLGTKVDEVASKLHTNHGWAFSIVHDCLNVRKVCDVPAADARKENCFGISQKLLKRYGELRGNNFTRPKKFFHEGIQKLAKRYTYVCRSRRRLFCLC